MVGYKLINAEGFQAPAWRRTQLLKLLLSVQSRDDVFERGRAGISDGVWNLEASARALTWPYSPIEPRWPSALSNACTRTMRP